MRTHRNSACFEVASVEPELTIEEAAEIMRHDIVVLLSRNPHCPIANLLGQALMDLYEQL
jgi:hypothetical protein